MYKSIVAFLVLVFAPVALVSAAHAQVHVDIGIHLPAPPQLVVVPEVRTVRYVPAAPGNLFFYHGQYWAFASGAWYVSARYNGPWIVVAPQYVPRPVLLVPVRYYRVPPGHWKHWARSAPPRWHDEWGRDWADKRAWKAEEKAEKRAAKAEKHEWKHHDDDRGGDGPGRGHGRGW